MKFEYVVRKISTFTDRRGQKKINIYIITDRYTKRNFIKSGKTLRYLEWDTSVLGTRKFGTWSDTDTSAPVLNVSGQFRPTKPVPKWLRSEMSSSRCGSVLPKIQPGPDPYCVNCVPLQHQHIKAVHWLHIDKVSRRRCNRSSTPSGIGNLTNLHTNCDIITLSGTFN